MNTTDMRYMMKCRLPLLPAALSMLLAVSCDKDIHENEYPLSDGQGALILGLESDAEVSGLTLYHFGSKCLWSYRERSHCRNLHGYAVSLVGRYGFVESHKRVFVQRD